MIHWPTNHYLHELAARLPEFLFGPLFILHHRRGSRQGAAHDVAVMLSQGG
jgi:hypothetical protein